MRKEIPILFSTAMVQAILEGRKSMTRRVVKYPKKITNPVVGWSAFTDAADREFCVRGIHENGQYGESFFKQPYCKGDVLWVRENWRVHNWFPDDGEMGIGFMVGQHVQTCYDLPEEMYNRLWEQSCSDLAKAGYEIGTDENYSDYDVKDLRQRPNIFLPKEGARIWLEVSKVRVERVTDISADDAVAEGIYREWDGSHYWYLNYLRDNVNDEAHMMKGLPKSSFQSLWMKINGADSWDDNPWVWVVEFKVLSTTGKPEIA